jgi:hypothetical protein
VGRKSGIVSHAARRTTNNPQVTESTMENTPACSCLELDYVSWKFDEKYLGSDRYYADISLRRCKHCGRLWLHYHYENEAFSQSGRWYRGLIAPEQAETIAAENALEFLGKLEWYLCGGSYFGRVFKASGPIQIWP